MRFKAAFQQRFNIISRILFLVYIFRNGIKVTLDLQGAFRENLSVRATLKKTSVNNVSL